MQSSTRIAPVELPLKTDKQCTLSGAKVYITLDAGFDRLVLLVQEERKMSWAWRAEFAASYLEEITRKTGQPLSYQEFVAMLVHGLSAQDPSSFIDLLNN